MLPYRWGEDVSALQPPFDTILAQGAWLGAMAVAMHNWGQQWAG